MVSILVTGMSGVGKSTALAELARRGFETVDTDDGNWISVVDGEPLWREERIDDLLNLPRTGHLFVAGTDANQGRFHARFDAVVLMTAPIEVIVHRLRTRTTNDFGKSAAEQAKILRDLAEFEPVLRSGATHELATTGTVDDVVVSLIAVADDLGTMNP
jgi:adenylate kinase family enzyme